VPIFAGTSGFWHQPKIIVVRGQHLEKVYIYDYRYLYRTEIFLRALSVLRMVNRLRAV